MPASAETMSTRTPPSVYLALAAGVFAISSSAILIRYAQAEQVPSLLIAMARLVIAALLLTPITLRRHWQVLTKLRGRDWLLAITAGAFLALHFVTWVSSLEYTSVLVSVVIVTTSPIWVALLETTVLRAPLPRPVMIGLLVAIGGGLLIGLSGDGSEAAGQSDTNLIGALLSLAGALAVSVYLIIGRKLRGSMPVLPYIWLVYGCAGVILLVIVALTQTPVTGYSSNAYIFLVAMALFPQLIGHTSLNFAIGYLPATIVSMVTQLEPIGSAFLALILFNEQPLLLQIIGSAIILSGVILATLGRSEKRRRRQTA